MELEEEGAEMIAKYYSQYKRRPSCTKHLLTFGRENGHKRRFSEIRSIISAMESGELDDLILSKRQEIDPDSLNDEEDETKSEQNTSTAAETPTTTTTTAATSNSDDDDDDDNANTASASSDDDDQTDSTPIHEQKSESSSPPTSPSPNIARLLHRRRDSAILPRTDFDILIQEYEQQFGYLPRTSRHLLTFATEKGLDFRWAAIHEQFTDWEVDNRPEEVTEEPETVATKGKIDDMSIWDDLIEKYETKHGYKPKLPLHLWNFALDQGYEVKFREARDMFGQMEEEMTPAPMIDPQLRATGKKKLTEEEFLDLLAEYETEYERQPRDNKQLYNWTKDRHKGIRFGAISRAWKRWEVQKKQPDPIPESEIERPKKRKLEREEFDGIYAQYVEQFKKRPQTGRQLHNFANESGFAVRFSAVNAAFNIWSDLVSITIPVPDEEPEPEPVAEEPVSSDDDDE